MNDSIAKITLCVIASLAIAAAVIVSAYTSSTIATAFIQLAAVCIGGISGVAIQGALSSKSETLTQTPVETIPAPEDKPDVV